MNIRLPLLFILTLLLYACGQDLESYGAREMPKASLETTYSPEPYENEGSADYAPSSPTPEADPKVAPKIVYTASARGRVGNLDTALLRLTRRITAAGGHISSQHRANSNWEHTATLTVRLPAGQLSGTLGFLPSLTEEMDYQNLDSRDVSAEWLDLESRLQTKRDVRDRYVEILRNRAQKVEDILNAEDKIRVITEEIEAKEGRLRYLRDQVSLSTLTLELYETREYQSVGPTTTRSFGSELVASLGTGWEITRAFFLGLVAIWPVLILLGAGFFFFRRWRRKADGRG